MSEENKPVEEGQQQPFWQRNDDLYSEYANNIQTIPSPSDLRIFFGQFDQNEKGGFVEQHTSITLAWSNVKVLRYLLSYQILIFEAQNGKIKVPGGGGIPAEFPAPPENIASDPNAAGVWWKLKALHDEFLADT